VAQGSLARTLGADRIGESVQRLLPVACGVVAVWLLARWIART